MTRSTGRRGLLPERDSFRPSRLSLRGIDDRVVAERSRSIQGGAAIERIFHVQVGAGFDGDLHGFEHQSFLCSAVDRNPFVAAAHAGGSHQDGRDIDTVSKDVFRGISALRERTPHERQTSDPPYAAGEDASRQVAPCVKPARAGLRPPFPREN